MTSCLVCWKNIVFHINTRVFIWYVCFDFEVAQFFQRNTNKVWTKFCLITEQAADHSILLTVFEIEPFRVGMLAWKGDHMN